MSSQQSGHRKRGIQASRARLTHALALAGLKTQSALAARIADLEGLDAIPKDMVNRAFREHPVEHTSLERIARALDVEAHTLYKTATETPPAEASASQESINRKAADHSPTLPAPGLLLAIAIVTAFTIWWWTETVSEPPSSTTTQIGASEPMLSLGKTHVVVLPLVGDDSGRVTEALRSALEADFNVATMTATAIMQGEEINEIATRLRADVVLNGEIVFAERLSAFRVFAYADGIRLQIWAESFPSVAISNVAERIAERAAAALRRNRQAQNPEINVPHFPLAPAQDEYLAGEQLLDRPHSELNLKRAESRFEAALRQDPNYAKAHAGLCQALLEEHWMFEEDRILEDASRACSRALQLDPESAPVAAAHAHFLARTGRLDEAIALYESIVAREPLYATGYEALAASLLDAYRQNGDATQLERAKIAARTAADVDPTIWKPLWYLATMEWFDGNNDAAIIASEAALGRDENEYILANLGTFYTCRGDFERAEAVFLRARELAPHSYIGDEYLGSIYYFLGDYARSVQLRRKAIDAIGDGEPEIHEMWGQLGDSYRMNGEPQKASDAYRRATEIAERDYLRGSAPAADGASRAYYYTVLGTLDSDLVPAEVEREIGNELDAIAEKVVEATAHRRMAQIWVLRDEPVKARRALELATASCPGYGLLPEFSELR